MAYLHATLQKHNNLTINTPFQLCFGKRAISIRKDFRNRFYHTSPIVECHAGTKAGHLEILLFRTWLVVFSQSAELPLC